MLQEMKGRIDDMTNALNNSASEKISRIKRVFEEAVGHELAKNYYICGQVGEVKKISLPREKVIDQRQASAWSTNALQACRKELYASSRPTLHQN